MSGRRLTAASLVLVALGLLAIRSAHSGGAPRVKGFEDYAALHGVHWHPPGVQHKDVRAVSSAADLEPVTPVEAATPRAECGLGSHPEAGRQGRVPLADYESGRASKPYTCNTELVSHYGITGGFQVHRYHDLAGRECAFYDSSLLVGKDVPKGVEPGVYVIDMSDPTRPVRTAALQSPAGLSPHESLRLNTARGLLAMNMGTATTLPGFVDVYDVSEDCRHPVLRSSLPLSLGGHEGGFSPDGRTYWVTTTSAPGVYAIDISDPSVPSIVWQTFDYAVHGLSFSADGTRAYLAQVSDFVTTTTSGAGGLAILDVTEIQNRVPNPTVREVATLTWPEVSIPQNNVPVTIGGRKHLVQFDEYDTNVFGNEPTDVVGGVHIIDINDETKPQIVGRIRLEVHQQEARATDQQADPGNQRAGQGYAAHYCAVPREVEPGIVACSMIASGLRLFDIREPAQPREVAYFNQPLVSGPDPSERGAYAMSAPAFAPERGEVWYSDSNTGFFNVRLTGEAEALLRHSPAGAPEVLGAGQEAAPPPPPRRAAGLPATGGTSAGATAGGAALFAALVLRRRRSRTS
jgi:hypothetical protein